MRDRVSAVLCYSLDAVLHHSREARTENHHRNLLDLIKNPSQDLAKDSTPFCVVIAARHSWGDNQVAYFMTRRRQRRFVAQATAVVIEVYNSLLFVINDRRCHATGTAPPA